MGAAAAAAAAHRGSRVKRQSVSGTEAGVCGGGRCSLPAKLHDRLPCCLSVHKQTVQSCRGCMPPPEAPPTTHLYCSPGSCSSAGLATFCRLESLFGAAASGRLLADPQGAGGRGTCGAAAAGEAAAGSAACCGCGCCGLATGRDTVRCTVASAAWCCCAGRSGCGAAGCCGSWRGGCTAGGGGDGRRQTAWSLACSRGCVWCSSTAGKPLDAEHSTQPRPDS